MTLIRLVEEGLLDLFSKGRLFGTTHTCIGQEAIAVGVLSHLKASDIVVSNHRCHGHYIAFTDDAEGLMLEVMGRQGGVCNGKGGSQHLCTGQFFSNGILGGMVPGAVGMALAEKRMGKDTVVVVFLGDGALGEGLVYESLNLASLWKAPVLFVVEHNQYAQSTPTRFQMAGTVAGRFAAFGIPHAELNTNDVTVIHESAGEAVGRVRASGSPECLILHTYRLSPHSKGDDFRDPAEIAHWRENDPLKLSAAQLEAEVASRIEAECQTRVQQAIKAASAAPFPEASEDNLSEYTS
ncbi:MAG: thiamine pyrophosphate-dependent dehydrogenase E1 component subunit alpha [Verrucomicrobiaceae bacterium]